MPPTDPHFEDLAVYALGAMTDDEAAAFEEQLAGCPSCQEELPRMRASVEQLEETPPELFLDGPPENAEFLVRGALRRIATPVGVAEPRMAGRGWLVTAAAAAAVVLLALGGIVGRQTAPTPVAGPLPTPAASAGPTPVPGTRDATAVDPATGVRLTVEVVPAAGWVRVTAATAGIPAGQRCHLLVVDRSGKKVEAGSWLVSAAGERDGVTLQGSAIVPPDDVASVRVENEAGDVLASTEV